MLDSPCRARSKSEDGARSIRLRRIVPDSPERLADKGTGGPPGPAAGTGGAGDIAEGGMSADPGRGGVGAPRGGATGGRVSRPAVAGRIWVATPSGKRRRIDGAPPGQLTGWTIDRAGPVLSASTAGRCLSRGLGEWAAQAVPAVGAVPGVGVAPVDAGDGPPPVGERGERADEVLPTCGAAVGVDDLDDGRSDRLGTDPVTGIGTPGPGRTAYRRNWPGVATRASPMAELARSSGPWDSTGRRVRPGPASAPANRPGSRSAMEARPAPSEAAATPPALPPAPCAVVGVGVIDPVGENPVARSGVRRTTGVGAPTDEACPGAPGIAGGWFAGPGSAPGRMAVPADRPRVCAFCQLRTGSGAVAAAARAAGEAGMPAVPEVRALPPAVL